MKLFLPRVRAALAEALSEEPMYELFGATLTALMSGFTFTFVHGRNSCGYRETLAVKRSRAWAECHSAIPYALTIQLGPPSFVGLWLDAFFSIHRMAKVVGVAIRPPDPCPWAWVFARRIEPGGNFLALTLLQSPVVVAYVWRIRNRNKRNV